MHIDSAVGRRKRITRVVRIFICLWFLGGGRPAFSHAQSGSTGAAIAGSALGLTSGATLAFVGSLVPCTQTKPGPTCMRWSSVGGGVLGLTGGAMIGASDSDRLGDVAMGAGIGFAAGAVAGMALKSAAERFGWGDVAAVGLLGGAIGSAPVGSAIGLAGGSALGLMAWGLWDSFELPDLIGAAAVGMAIGGLAEWLAEGIDASSGPAAGLQVTLPAPGGL
jgi:hypothetical protein